MTNSLLLRIAVGLCIANTLCSLWSAVTVSNARSRLSRAEQAIESTSSAVEKSSSAFAEMKQRIDADAAAHAVSDKAVADRLAAMDKQAGELGKAVEEVKKAVAVIAAAKP